MNPTAFIDILNQEDLSEFKDIKQLDRLLKNHPYFQIGLAAKSKYLRANQHIDYVKTSRKTAVIFPDRAKLHQFLNQSVVNKTVQSDQIESPTETSHIVKTKEHLNKLPDKKSVSDLIVLPPNELEKDYLVEAINQSIQLEASVYSIEDTSDIAEGSNDIAKDSKSSENVILSFSEWLTGKKKITSDQIHINLIDDFISENPVISPVQKKEFYSPIEKGKESISDSNLPFSETLAEIFASQGNKEMAIKGYKKLMLKYPEKSTYFAGLIKKIKES